MDQEYSVHYTKSVVVAVIVTIVLTILVFLHYKSISSRPGSLVIPAGNTYLGVSPTPATSAPTTQALARDTWRPVHGHIYPYTFSAPATLKLVTFPQDPYDIYAIDCCGLDPGSNVLIGVDNLKNASDRAQYINMPKLNYVQNWWKQFGALNNVGSIDEFTNSKGLKGFKAKYVNAAGETPNLDVFFEVPGHPEYVIHLASGTLTSDVFARVIDSLEWGAL